MSETILVRARRRLWRARRIYGAELRSLFKQERAPDGLPVPPARLRFLSVGTTKVSHFLADGRSLAEMISDTLASHGAALERGQALLDFGVGAGRIARYWHRLDDVEVHGTDMNAALVRWCAANLRFGTFVRNELTPPLRYPEERFDVVYATSVFAHLPDELQTAWAQELRRVLRPAGHLLITTHGERFARARLKGEELERFLEGELVVRQAESAGSNRCAAFHPFEYVRDYIGRGFKVLEQRPGGGPEMPPVSGVRQDVHLLRKTSGVG